MLDEVIHQTVRLKIMAALVSLDEGVEVDFVFLKRQLDLTDGNLGSHLKRLEMARYVLVEKAMDDTRNRSFVSATDRGRSAYAAHIKALRTIIGTGTLR